MHLKTEPAEVMKDEVHAPCEVFSRLKWECTIVNIKALENFVGGECSCREHCRCVTANFPFDHVVITSSHDFENGDVLLAPYDYERFGKRSHEEEKEDRGHVVTLAHSDCLGYFNFFFFNFQDACVVSVNSLDCCYKLWRGTVLFKDL